MSDRAVLPPLGGALRVLRRDRAMLTSYPAGAAFAERVLEDNELVLLLDGGATWTSDGAPADLVPGSVLLAPAGSRDHYRWHPARPTRHAYVHFETEGPPPARVLRHGPATGLVAHLFRHLVWLDARTDPAARALADATFDVLLATVCSGLLPDTDQPDDLPPALHRAVAHVRRRWADGVLRPVSQAELAAAAGLSVGAISRLFRRHLGAPPATALEAVRLARAAALARTSGQPFQTVAAACGFADAYHLAHRFRAVHGTTPTEVRGGRPVPVPPGVRRLEQALFADATAAT